jgi:hypothetical protein
MGSACDPSRRAEAVNPAPEALLGTLPEQSSTAEPKWPPMSMAVRTKPLPYGLTAICIPRGLTHNEETEIRAQLGLPPRPRQQRHRTHGKGT